MKVVKLVGKVCLIYVCDLWKKSLNDFDHTRLKFLREA